MMAVITNVLDFDILIPSGLFDFMISLSFIFDYLLFFVCSTIEHLLPLFLVQLKDEVSWRASEAS